MIEDKVHMCVVCAWRGDCKKKFAIQKDPNPRCADFSRDVSIKSKPDPKDDAGESDVNKK